MICKKKALNSCRCVVNKMLKASEDHLKAIYTPNVERWNLLFMGTDLVASSTVNSCE